MAKLEDEELVRAILLRIFVFGVGGSGARWGGWFVDGLVGDTSPHAKGAQNIFR